MPVLAAQNFCPINVVLENKCYRAAAILMLSAIDTMAFLAMPEVQDDVTRTDFVEKLSPS